MKGYFQKRFDFVDYGNQKLRRVTLTCGFFQGSAVVSFLFLLYINYLPSQVEKSRFVLLSDDTTVFAHNLISN